MLFPEEDGLLLKPWIVKRLENTSDADADVLADYVLALLRHDGSIEDVRKLCEEEIKDFLKEDTAVFVNDIFDAIRYKSYVPGAPPPPKQQHATAQVPQHDFSGFGAPTFPQAPLGSAQGGARKRTFQDRGEADAPSGGDQFSGNRGFKQPRRGGALGARGGRMDNMNGTRGGGRPKYGIPNAPVQTSPHPSLDATMPEFHLNNPFDAIIKMQQMGIPLPPMPDFSQTLGYQPQRQQRRRGRCRDYDTKGYCARGENCMFEHINDNLPAPQSSGHIQVPNEEYDPNTATMMMDFASQMSQLPQQSMPFPINGRQSGFQRDNRQRYQHPVKRRTRAPFSADGPVHDRSKSTVVIENIPEDYFTEEQVRGFFTEFGNIVEVSMQPYKRLAIVKFDNWKAANAAYRSPKVVFDNRFVKVYWHKDEDESTGTPVNDGNPLSGQKSAKSSFFDQQPTDEDIDMEEFTRRQEEAQKMHEEKMQKKQEVEKKRLELEARHKELLAKHDAEKQKLLAKLAGSSQKASSEPNNDTPMEEHGGDTSKPTSQTEALKATLAKLEAEAKLYGLDPDAGHEEEEEHFGPWNSSRGRGRGGYIPRGRGGYPPRGGYQPRGVFRGGPRGRADGNVHAAYAAYSLDNRPRRVAVSGVDFTAPEKDEALKRHLFGLGDFTDVQTTPVSTLISFKDRKAAEKFFYGLPNKEIPGIEGQVELSWVNNTTGSALQPSGSTNTATSHDNHNGNVKSEDVLMGGANGSGDTSVMEQSNPNQQLQENADMDYDVAGENEWDIE